jgi:DNA-directed RNA polymerase subunit beta'
MVVRNRQAGIRKGHNIPIYKYFRVSEGDHVRKGDQLTEGPVDPHDTLEILGLQEFQEWLVKKIQEIYGLQGVTIHEKHLEIIVRQMLRHVPIADPGDTRFLSGEEVGKTQFEEENARVQKAGGQPAEAQLLFLGITKASLKSDSFLTAAGFQHTTQVLTEAAVMSKRDDILGLKAKIITGGLIPAGTGFGVDRKRSAKPPGKSASKVDSVAPSPPAA